MMNPLLPGADMRCVSALDDGSIKGIFLFPAMHKYSMHDHRVHSLLSIVAGYPGTVIYVHCGMLSVRIPEETRAPLAIRYAAFRTRSISMLWRSHFPGCIS